MEEEELGKTLERVPRGVRCRMRRARIALSREVGIRFVDSEEDGLVMICCGEGSDGRDELLVSWRRVLKSKASSGAFGMYIARVKVAGKLIQRDEGEIRYIQVRNTRFEMNVKYMQ